MSETSARARRFARWFGSFERKGFSGRRAPESLTVDGVPAEGVTAADTGEVGGVEVARAAGVGREAAGGTKGAGAGDEKDGGGGADAGGPLGRKGRAIGGGVNSGNPEAGEGGVAVAAALLRSTASGLAGA